MKILIAVPDTEVGGVNTAAINLSNELSSRGHTVYFLNMPGNNKCIDRLNENVNRVCFRGKSRLWNIGVESVRQARGLKKLGIIALGAIKKLTIRSGLWYKIIFSRFKDYGTFDVAVAFRQCAPCYSFVLNKVNAKKKMGFVHGELTYMGDISSWKKYMTRFDKIAYVSNAVKDGFIEAYPELGNNACTIYNMFDVERIIEMSKNPLPVELDKSIFNIVTVSRIEDTQKQICRIPHIAKRLKENGINSFKWYILGYGPDIYSNKKLAEDLNVNDVVVFVGQTNNPFSWFLQADLMVLPTRWESYGLVVLESAILKTPVVVSEYPALHEIMENEKHGLIAEQSVESLTECVARMIENRDGIKEKCTEYLSKITINNDVAYKQFLDAVK